MLKGLEKRKQTLEVKLHEIQDSITERKDDAVDFKMMGIDHRFVDESHQFKNLMFNTRHDRVSGLGNPDGSQRALNMLFAIRTIQVFPLSYLFQKNQYKCDIVPSHPTVCVVSNLLSTLLYESIHALVLSMLYLSL